MTTRSGIRYGIFVAAAIASSRGHAALAGGAVVTDGRFTNVYVYPNSDKETWEQHIATLRKDAATFSRAAIDKFTARLMSPQWPSYFDRLGQYGVRPPQFFGSAVASKRCVDAALKDRFKGVLQWDTIRSLSNCHLDGMDPSPQVNLIFSPDIKIAKVKDLAGRGGDMCIQKKKDRLVAYHAWGVNTPNFTVLPTSVACTEDIESFERTMTHEIVETITDPAGLGMGEFGRKELSDDCGDDVNRNTTWRDLPVTRYWSNEDRGCVPIGPPPDSKETVWVLSESSPIQRFTGSVHKLDLSVPKERLVTDAAANQVQIVVQTGDDDLRGGNNQNDNANVTLNFVGGTRVTTNINRASSWENGHTHAARLDIPTGMRVSDITGITMSTNFGGGFDGDNWNVNKVALVVAFPKGSKTKEPPPTIVHEWLDVSGAPRMRFTGDKYYLTEAIKAEDVGKPIRALDLVISTGNDDLRGGDNDNCEVYIELTDGRTIDVMNVNQGRAWKNSSTHTVSIPMPKGGIKGGDVKLVELLTHFKGGFDGDNWNVNRIQLLATLNK